MILKTTQTPLRVAQWPLLCRSGQVPCRVEPGSTRQPQPASADERLGKPKEAPLSNLEFFGGRHAPKNLAMALGHPVHTGTWCSSLMLAIACFSKPQVTSQPLALPPSAKACFRQAFFQHPTPFCSQGAVV